MELPSWKLSPKRRALMGMPGSGHSLCPNAAVKITKKKKRKADEWGRVGEKNSRLVAYTERWAHK